MATENNNYITIRSEILADIDTVWNYWTNPEHITNWNFASNDWCCPYATNDLREGGKFTWRMESRDGDMGFDFGGTYLEVDPKKKLVYRLFDDRNVTVQFNKKEKSVEVIEIFEPESTNPIEMQKEGWQAILNNFKQYTEIKNTNTLH